MTDIKKPNFIIFMTDQQRTTHLFPEFPADWIKKNLPNYKYFLDNGVVFDNNICNASPCGPSRGSIFTGQYPANNGIVDNSGSIHKKDMRFTKVLIEQGYDIFYKGKLHLHDNITKFSQNWTQDIISAPEKAQEENSLLDNLYGLKKWTSPDFGTLLAQADPSQDEIATIAGGSGHNDNRIVTGEYKIYEEQESVISFLREVQDTPRENPFCLVVSLLNPHDVSLYPSGWQEAGYQNAVFDGHAFEGISLPESYMDSLDSKPSTQATYLNSVCHGKLSETRSVEGSINYPLNYLKFYAYLHTLSDRLLGTVKDVIGKDLLEDSILIRMADHGEMAMSHGGLVEKNNSAYNETIRVPMMWVHPTFKPGRRDQLVSLIDLVPTMGSLAGSDLNKHAGLQGVDYSSCLYDDKIDVQDGLIFNFNPIGPALDGKVSAAGNSGTKLPPTYVANNNAPAKNAPGSIYALVKKDWKYVVYFDNDQDGNVDWSNAQYELYNLNEDWNEMNNLLPINAHVSNEARELQRVMQVELSTLMAMRGIDKPQGWDDWSVDN